MKQLGRHRAVSRNDEATRPACRKGTIDRNTAIDTQQNVTIAGAMLHQHPITVSNQPNGCRVIVRRLSQPDGGQGIEKVRPCTAEAALIDLKDHALVKAQRGLAPCQQPEISALRFRQNAIFVGFAVDAVHRPHQFGAVRVGVRCAAGKPECASTPIAKTRVGKTLGIEAHNQEIPGIALMGEK
ncbi:MAG: hypothetical protein F9K47_09300 [Burkholderiales bacterium]|nr:MAG: hypothetical protein F9K47_09300 [Burkholderiales bacterium]